MRAEQADRIAKQATYLAAIRHEEENHLRAAYIAGRNGQTLAEKTNAERASAAKKHAEAAELALAEALREAGWSK